MAYDGWLEFNGVELVNLSRTVQLAEAIGYDALWINLDDVAWIDGAVGGVDYELVNNAPWYDENYPASGEFAGIVPLGFPGLDDSTTEASTVEYITDGGRSGKQRNSTLSIVASVAIIASTARGAEFGKRWLDRMLRNSDAQTFCAGAELKYFRYPDASAPVAHRRDVRLTRAASITRKRSTACSETWLATFTLTCDDPYEYGEAQTVLYNLGGSSPTGAISSGSVAMVQESCPVYDYSPVYDPLYPALVPSPTAPDFYPAGWNIADDMPFTRYWARVPPLEPSTLRAVPLIGVITGVDARRVRVSVWPSDSEVADQCDPLFSAVVTYLPANITFYIDGEQKAAYVWDGASDGVRRTDSLVYGPDARPVEWAAFSDNTNLLVTLDIFTDAGPEGEGTVRASLALIPKSD